jgi:serine/threonine protein kinase
MERDPFDLVGDVLDGQFRVDAFAGEGDLSVVYKGHHLGVDAPVAIKCLNLPETLDPVLARPLVDEFKEASRVHYRLARGNLHIAQTIASGSTLIPRSGVVVPYLVREWFEGESLASDLAWRRAEKRTGRSLDETLTLLETAFDGIAHAHAQNEVHLSINPSNLFVMLPDGDALPTLKVLDFGVACTMNALASSIPSGPRAGRSQGGLRLLFPAYAAPEQLDRAVGELGPWTDVYALALVMMEVLSDRIVMGEGDSGAIVEHALDEQRRPTPQAHGLKLPSHIDRALARAVSRTPSRRQKSAAELWKDVRNSVRTLAPKAITPMPTPAPSMLTPQPVAAPAPGRPRSATLVGLSPPAVIPVPGAVQRVTGSTSVVTKPMAFEPAGALPSAAAARVASTPLPIAAVPIPSPLARISAVPSPPVAAPVSAPPLPVSAPPLPPASAPVASPAPPTSATPGPQMPETPSAVVLPASPALSTAQPRETPDPLAATIAAPVLSPFALQSPVAAAPAALPLSLPLPPPAIESPPPSSTDFSRDNATLRVDRRLLDYVRRRFADAFAFAFSPRGAPIVLAVSGVLFWTWALGIFIWFVGLPLRHRQPPVDATEPIAEVAPAPSPAAAAPPASAAQTPEAPQVPAAAPATGSTPFRNAAAIRALDTKWRDIAKCRRGKTWGKASTTVTFAGDGSVTHVDVSAPFAGTPTGDCIVDKLSSTRVEPFNDDSAVVVYKVYVAPK